MREMARDLVGKVAGGYRIGDVLSRGEASTVYEAEHSASGRRAVVKVFSLDLPRDKGVADRLVSQVRRSTEIKHPNLVEVLDVGIVDHKGKRYLYVVMARVKGESLRQRLAAQPDRPLPLALALQITSDVGAALNALHEQGVAHGALDSGAVLLGKQDAGEDEVPVRLLDPAGAIVQAHVDGEEPLPARKQDDLKDLAALLEEMLDPGQEAPADMPQAILPLRQRNREVPVRVDAAIRRALGGPGQDAKEGEFPSVASFLAAVLGTGDTLPFSSRPEEVPARRSGGISMGWVVGLLAVAGGVGLWLHNREPAGPVAVAVDMARPASTPDLMAIADLTSVDGAQRSPVPSIDQAGANRPDLATPADLASPETQQVAPPKKRPHRAGPPIPHIRGPIDYNPNLKMTPLPEPAAAKPAGNPEAPKVKPKRPKRTGPPIPSLRLLRP